MRFAQVHKFAAYTLAILGLVALGAGGELQGVSALLLAVGVAASWFAEGDLLHDERYTRTWNVAIVLAFVAQVARAVFTNTLVLTATVEFAALLQLLKLANRRTARDYQQITVLALLHLIAATVLGGGLSYAVCFVGFVIATPWAMTLGHLRREIEGNYLADARAGRAGVPIDVARILRSRRVVGVGLLAGSSLLAVPIFVLTALIFVLFPRIGIGVFNLRQHGENTVAGFGNSVDLSGHGVIRNDPTIVLRVEPLDPDPRPPPVRSFRLRGATFDTYNGHGWTRRSGAMDTVALEHIADRYAMARLPDPARDQGLRIVLDPLDPPVVLIPEGTVGLQVAPHVEGGFIRYPDLTVDRDDGVRYPANEELGFVYTAWIPRTNDSRLRRSRTRESLDRYVQLPSSVSPAVRELALRITAGETGNMARARAVERHLAGFRYTLQLESGEAAQPVEDFLFRTHAGHCEYFSTAMAVLLRSVGVPTRNVTGFLGGTYNRYGHFYAVHQGDAHSWVEVYDPDHGWVTFDPTPPAGEAPVVRTGPWAEIDAVVEAARLRWRTYVVGFDLNTQASLALRVWRFVEARRGDGLSPGDWHRTGHRMASHARRIPWRPIAAVMASLVAAAGLYFTFRRGALRRGPTGSLPAALSVREAQALARALDAALAARGHVRPVSAPPLRFAAEVARRGDPVGPVAERIAARYVAARFGHDPLRPGEADALRAELRAATAPPSPPSVA